MVRQFQVLIDPKHSVDVDTDTVAFGSFKGSFVFEGPSALASFYSELILGKPFPLKLLMRDVSSASSLLVVTLFLRRDLAIHPKMFGLFAAATLADQYREAGLAHIDSDVGRFFQLIEEYLPSDLSRTEQRKRLTSAVDWVADYVTNDRLPALPPQVPVPTVLDVGTDGFVLAETDHTDLRNGWVELYRQGFLRGVLFCAVGERRHALVARKSPFLVLDLRKGADILNEAEAAMSEPPGWLVDGLWLHSPEGGTLLPMNAVVQILVRI